MTNINDNTIAEVKRIGFTFSILPEHEFYEDGVNDIFKEEGIQVGYLNEEVSTYTLNYRACTIKVCTGLVYWCDGDVENMKTLHEIREHYRDGNDPAPIDCSLTEIGEITNVGESSAPEDTWFTRQSIHDIQKQRQAPFGKARP